MQRADEDDYWLYQVLQKGLVRTTQPRINAAKLAALFQVAEREIPWKFEISGRVLSLAMDIRQFAEARATQNSSLKFRHLLDIPVSRVRQVPNCDVWLTPTSDPAHADLTYGGAVTEDEGSPTIPHDILLAMAEALTNALNISDPAATGGLDRIESLRPAR